VVLVRLDDVKVRSFALRETILSIELELSSDDRIFTPAMHVESSFSKNESSRIRNIGSTCGGSVLSIKRNISTRSARSRSIVVPALATCGRTDNSIHGSRHLEKVIGDECTGTIKFLRSAKGMDGIRKSIDRIGVVERLSSKSAEKSGISLKR